MRKLLLFLIIFTSGIVLFGTFGAKINCAEAKLWTRDMVCPNPAAGGQTVGKIIDKFYSGISSMNSVDINFYTTVSSPTKPPLETKIWVQVGSDPNAVCSDVKCLSRYDEGSKTLDGGTASITLSNIGCSDGGCRVGGIDSLPVIAYLTTKDNKTQNDPEGIDLKKCTVTMSGTKLTGGNLDITDGNGESREINVSIACKASPVTVCTAPPKPTVVISCPNGPSGCN